MLTLRLETVLALSFVCLLSGAASKTFDIVDQITDLEWKRSPATRDIGPGEDVTKSTQDAVANDERPSSTRIEAILMNPTTPQGQPPLYGSNYNNNQQEQLLQLAASRLLGQLMDLPEGKRRLDDDGSVTPLASNQLWRANSYRKPPLRDDDANTWRQQRQERNYRRSNNNNLKSNRRQMHPVNHGNSMESGRRSSSGRRPSATAAASAKMPQLNYNINGPSSSATAAPQRRQVAASRQQRQFQPRMAANDRNRARQARAMPAARANGGHSDESEPSDDEIFNDDDGSSSSERRSASGDESSDRTLASDRYDGSADEDSSHARPSSKQVPLKRQVTPALRGQPASNEARQRSARAGVSTAHQAAEAIRHDGPEQAAGHQDDETTGRGDRFLSPNLGDQSALGEEDQAGDDESLSASHLRQQQSSSGQQQQDLQAAAGHHHGHHHGHYYQYVEVPKKKAWKFGFKRGNHKHTISRHEKGHKNKFHSAFKWHAKEKCKKKDKCESKGKMTWHYEHHDKKHHH